MCSSDLGKFKNESIDQITEFVGLRSKLYAYKTDNDHESKKCKGVKKYVVNKDIIFENYKTCLFGKEIFKRDQNSFRSYFHRTYTEKVNKCALSFNDDKVYIDSNNINTFAHGHYKIDITNCLLKKIRENKNLVIL